MCLLVVVMIAPSTSHLVAGAAKATGANAATLSKKVAFILLRKLWGTWPDAKSSNYQMWPAAPYGDGCAQA